MAVAISAHPAGSMSLESIGIELDVFNFVIELLILGTLSIRWLKSKGWRA